jgi:KDO2-lipid IV(A) lauroyltransferase
MFVQFLKLNSLLSHIAIVFLKIAGFFPLSVLFFLSYKIRWLLSRLITYRYNVIKKNLSRSFPHLTEDKIKMMIKDYYTHLSHLLVENIWAQRITASELKERCVMDESLLKYFNQFYKEQKSFIVVMGHTGNWEWSGLATPPQVSHQVYALYRPLKNKLFDRFFYKFRTRTGMHLISMQQAPRIIHLNHQNPVCFTFIADQSPPPEQAVWTTFLNQETGFFKGYEVLARKYKLPVVYVSQKKIAFGRYKIFGEIITTDASKEPENSIVLSFVSRLENDIKDQPECWLWSHRRWKHARPAHLPLLSLK